MSIKITLCEKDSKLIKDALWETFIKNKMIHKNVQNTIEANYLIERINSLLENYNDELPE